MNELAEKILQKLAGEKALKLISQVESGFTFLPNLPASWVKILAKLVPYLAIFGLIYAVWQILTDAQALISSFSYVAFNLTFSEKLVIGVRLILNLLAAFLLYRAIKPLKNYQRPGWLMLFWNEVIAVLIILLSSIILSDYAYTVLLAISTFVAFYILFQIKSEYK